MSSGISGIGRLLRKVHAFSLAPQMDYTTAHQRFLFRLLTNHAALYTEMVTANALCHSNDPIRFLRGAERENTAEERPGRVELQLGGSDPSVMAAATKIALSHGFRHFNLNCGCPSDKVAGGGQFGVALMRKPKLVRELCEAISDASGNAVSVKCRIGIDDDDSFDFLQDFVNTVTDRGCGSGAGPVDHVILHARKALLGKKFSPADNRKVPPLRYDVAHRLAMDFPHLAVTLNGGMRSVDDCIAELVRSDDLEMQKAFVQEHMNTPRSTPVTTATSPLADMYGAGARDGEGTAALAGVMVGRATIDNPFAFSNIDSRMYGEPDQNFSRGVILQKYCQYAAQVEQDQGSRCRRSLIKPLFGLFAGEANGKIFRANMDMLVRDGDVPVSDAIQRAAESLHTNTLDMTPSQWLHREQEAQIIQSQGKSESESKRKETAMHN